ncbi:hypothetical protein P7C73_g4791, partial [Tremellales sp. Uapishka_1]
MRQPGADLDRRRADDGFEALKKTDLAVARGRRVVVKGVPGMIMDPRVRALGKDCGIEDLLRLPPSPRSIVSTWVFTTESVAMAYKLSRKIHMNYFMSTIYGEQYLMRAEVA